MSFVGYVLLRFEGWGGGFINYWFYFALLWNHVLAKLRPRLHKCIFVVIENTSIDSLPHNHFDAFSAVHTKTFENDRIARCDVSWTLCGHRSVIVFISMRFYRFRPSKLIRYVCDFILIYFQKSLSVLVWIEDLNASKCKRFQTKTHSCGLGIFSVWIQQPHL